MECEPRRVAQVTVALDAREHRRLLELAAERMLAEGRRVSNAEIVRRLILEAPTSPMSRGPRVAA